jgi:hypothetical protein
MDLLPAYEPVIWCAESIRDKRVCGRTGICTLRVYQQSKENRARILHYLCDVSEGARGHYSLNRVALRSKAPSLRMKPWMPTWK